MELKLKTLTPLWTGGVNGKMNRIYETGIIGSLRWWFEVLVRGLGGLACDPTQDERSIFDLQKYERSKATDERTRLRDAGLCDVSQVFGATGWQRRFRLTLENTGTADTQIQHPIRAERTYQDAKGNKRPPPIWYFPNKAKTGPFTIQLQSLAPNFMPEVIAGLLQFVADWAAIGARAQMGFGVITPLNGALDTWPLYNWLIATAADHRYSRLPSLKNLFLARVHLQNSTDQDTFNLKYDLRQLFAGDQNKDLRHFIMGTIQGGRMAAKVKMSRPYENGLMRVWGWIPEEANAYQGSWSHDAVTNAIFQHLKANYTVQVWREMSSSRDTIAPNNNDARAFLRSLLRLEEEYNAV